MVSETKPLFCLNARDLMSSSLVMIPADMSLKGAARMLAQAAVSGAPVVNNQGRCIGVLSATDFVHSLGREHFHPVACAASPAFCAAWQVIDAEELPNNAVRDYMTCDPVTVGAATTIGELAHKMISAHIHRVIVVDKNEQPIGIVSSTDILAAVAKADQARNLEDQVMTATSAAEY